MSLGFIPLLIAMLLSEFTSADIAVYVGATIGILSAVFYYYTQKQVHYILFSAASILIICCIIALFMPASNSWPQQLLPITIEIAIILPLLFIYLNRKRVLAISHNNKDPEVLKERVRIVTLTTSSIRVFFGLTTIHFAFITVGLLLTRSLDNGFMWFLQHIGPINLLTVSILAGQIELNILRNVKAPEFVPVVTPQGEVVGTVDKNLAEEYKNEHTHPIVRIAVASHGMLFLTKRSAQRVIEKEKMDIPLETYLLFKEEITDGVKRVLKEVFPNDWEHLKPEFSIKYKFKNQETDRVVYLFILDLGSEDEILCDPKFDCGKLWTFQQIEQNLDQNYFSEMFENEYDHLKLIIETREIYRES